MQEFAKFVQIFSYSSPQDAKLKGLGPSSSLCSILTHHDNLSPLAEAFKVHDFDGDGKISRDDLRAYCALVFPKVLDSEGDSAAQAQQEVIVSVCIHIG